MTHSQTAAAPVADEEMLGDVVSVLVSQHGRIRDLFGEVAAAVPEARAEPFARLVRFLAVHETAEEMVIRPLTMQFVDGGDAIAADRSAEEHDAKEILADLEEMGPEDRDFPEVLERLRQAVLRHARSEERYEFSKLRAAASPQELATAARLVRAAEALAPTHPHPAVDSPAANLLAGPVLAVVDRVRDVVASERRGGR